MSRPNIEDYDSYFKGYILQVKGESFNEIYKVLKKSSSNKGGIFHCFTGTLEDANKIIDLGMKIGIGGVVTFKNGKIDKFLD